MTLIVHHLQVSQSERVPWLCEELGIKYELKLHQRDPLFSPKSIKDLNKLGQAPVIQDGDLTLAESGACIEYINNKYGNGSLALPPSHKNYASYLYWWHWSNSNFQPLISRLMLLRSAGVTGPPLDRTAMQLGNTLKFLDDRVKDNEWLAGTDFTVADIMLLFSLTTMRVFYPLDLSKYSNVLVYIKRASERDGFKKARAKADPQLALAIDGPAPQQFIDTLRAQGKM